MLSISETTTTVASPAGSRTLRNVAYAIIVAAAVAFGLLGATSSAQAAIAPAPTLVRTTMLAQQTQVDIEVLKLINDARRKVGAPALQPARGATKVAHTWSSYMATTLKTIAHNTQTNTRPGLAADMKANGTRNATFWGENVLFGSAWAMSPQAIFNAYWNSPGHRANMLNKSFRYIGIASVLDPAGEFLYNTQDFSDKVEAGQVFTMTTLATTNVTLVAAGKGVSGATVAVMDATCRTTLAQGRTNAHGKVTLKAKAGVLCIRQAAVPAGYKATADKKINAAPSATYNVTAGVTAPAKMTVRATYKGKNVAGVKIQILDASCTKSIHTFTTKANTAAFSLAAGVYCVKSVSAPKGFKLPSARKVTISSGKTIATTFGLTR